jgi:hypothetical protein
MSEFLRPVDAADFRISRSINCIENVELRLFAPLWAQSR